LPRSLRSYRDRRALAETLPACALAKILRFPRRDPCALAALAETSARWPRSSKPLAETNRAFCRDPLCVLAETLQALAETLRMPNLGKCVRSNVHVRILTAAQPRVAARWHNQGGGGGGGYQTWGSFDCMNPFPKWYALANKRTAPVCFWLLAPISVHFECGKTRGAKFFLFRPPQPESAALAAEPAGPAAVGQPGPAAGCGMPTEVG
jgi:hypothetical protein